MFHVIGLLTSFIFVGSVSEVKIKPNHQFCPITNNPSFVSPLKFYKYPLELYDLKSVKMGKLGIEDSRFVKCRAADDIWDVDYSPYTPRFNWQNYTTCPDEKTTFHCPILPENVEQMTNKTSRWIDPNYLCKLHSYLQNPNETIQIISIGGSVTSGCLSQGCCADRQCQTARETLFSDNKICAWTNYLGNWLASHSKAKVKFYNLAYPGFASDVMNEKIMELMFNAGIKVLSDRDIVFIDHAVNDWDFSDGSRYKKLEIAIESLFLKFLTYGHPKKSLNSHNSHITISDNSMQGTISNDAFPHASNSSKNDTISGKSVHSYPSIIILDSETKCCDFEDDIPYEFYKYFSVYERLARHYNIPMWSYRDAVKNGFILHARAHYKATNTSFNDKDYPYIAHVQIFNAPRNNKPHVPWHVHLFHAELLANSLLKSFHHCAAVSTTTTTTKSNSTQHNGLETYTPYRIPAPYNEIKPEECGETHFLKISYDDVLTHRPYTGTFYMPEDKWKLTTDIKGRYGFIRTVPENGDCTSHINAEIFFSLTISLQQLIQQQDRQQLHLSITHLKSYTNTGTIDVLLCGIVVDEIHSYWDDWQHYKRSIPQIHKKVLTIEQIKLVCKDVPETELLQIKLVHKVNCVGNEINSSAPYGPHQMVKITAISVC